MRWQIAALAVIFVAVGVTEWTRQVLPAPVCGLGHEVSIGLTCRDRCEWQKKMRAILDRDLMGRHGD